MLHYTVTSTKFQRNSFPHPTVTSTDFIFLQHHGAFKQNMERKYNIDYQ